MSAAIQVKEIPSDESKSTVPSEVPGLTLACEATDAKPLLSASEQLKALTNDVRNLKNRITDAIERRQKIRSSLAKA